MARVTVSSEVFQKGQLPPTCAMSGAIARENFAIAAGGRRNAVIGAIPLTGAAVQNIRAMQRLTMACFFTSVVLMSLAIGGQVAWLGWASLTALLAASSLLVLTYNRNIRAKIASDGRIILDHVHVDFVDAVESAAKAPAGAGKKCAGCTNPEPCSVTESADAAAGKDCSSANA